MKIAIIINSERLTESLQQKLADSTIANQYDLSYDLFVLTAEKITQQLKEMNCKAYNAILIGGGDGTVRSALQILIDMEVPIAILPLGTVNLLARDIGYPNDIESLFKIIKNNKTKQIDLAEVNNEIIINHAWIGFYYYILKFRKKHKSILGRSKLLKILFNTINIFNAFPIYKLTLETNDREVFYKTCLVYISNNESLVTLQNFSERKTLSSGLIWITILKCHTRWELVKCIFLALITGVKKSKYISQFSTNKLTITTELNMINAVIDGELFKLEVPLNFTIHQKKLTMIVP